VAITAQRKMAIVLGGSIVLQTTEKG
jgi:hypothetical protein